MNEPGRRLRFKQTPFQGCPRPVQTALHCLHADSLMHGNLFVTEIAQFPQHQNFPKRFTHGTQGPLHGIGCRYVFSEIPVGAQILGKGRGVFSPPDDGYGTVACDSIQPRTQRSLTPKFWQRLPGLKQGVLDRVFGIIGIPCDSQANGPEHFLVFFHQAGKCGIVTALCGRNVGELVSQPTLCIRFNEHNWFLPQGKDIMRHSRSSASKREGWIFKGADHD